MHESVSLTASPPPSVHSDDSWDSLHQRSPLPVDPVTVQQELHQLALPLDSVMARMQSETPPLKEETGQLGSLIPAIPSNTSTTQRALKGRMIDPNYNFEDGNIIVQVEQHLFRIHEYKLKEFKEFRALLEAAQKNEKGRKKFQLPGNAGDFRRMLAVLYSTGYEQTIFDSNILKSALRLAATHNHPTLRTFAIQNLEKQPLPAIERFELSRDCNIESWMSEALNDLCWREEPISVDEAQSLGFEKFVEIASRREALKFERGSRIQFDPTSNTPATLGSASSQRQPSLATTPGSPRSPAATQPRQSGFTIELPVFGTPYRGGSGSQKRVPPPARARVSSVMSQIHTEDSETDNTDDTLDPIEIRH